MKSKPGTTLSLGEKVRKYRAQNGLTLARLSALSSISISTLSKLENGQTSLNLRSVIRLAEGFSMPVALLINEDDGSGSGACSFSWNGRSRAHNTPQLDFMVLCSELPSQHNVFWKVRVKSHTIEEFGPYHSHPGEEFFLVIEGAVDFLREGHDPVRLRTGDSVHFDSAIGHAYLSANDGTSLILMSNTISDRPVQGFTERAAASTGARTPRSGGSGIAARAATRRNPIKKKTAKRGGRS